MFMNLYKKLLQIDEMCERKHLDLEQFKKEHRNAINILYKHKQISQEEKDKLLKVLDEI